MSYQKQNFANGEVLTASQMNHIEDGIADLESNSGVISVKITEETTRAKAAEQALSERTAALESCGFVVVNGKVCMKYVKS